MKRKSLLFLLLFALIAPWAAMGQETLTVYESETGTNSYIPIYGLWADANQQSEFIIPASELEDLLNGTISKMTFHLNQQANKVWDGTAQVYLREVEETAFSSMNYYGLSGSELVYNGALDAYTTNEMVVPFSSTYTYGGGNLLVGFIWTTGGNYGSAVFYGKTDATNASISHYGTNSPSAKNFIPRTTFTYTPGAAPTCARPAGLAINYQGGTTAEVSWNSDATAWNIDVNGTVTAITTNPYTLTNLELGTAYTVKVQANCGGGDLSDWTSPKSFTTDLCMPEDMCEITYELADSYGDGWNGNTLSVVDVATTAVLATWTIPSGSSASGSLALCDGREIQFVWAGTSWPSENSFTVYDINGEIICQHIKDDVGPAVGILSNYTVSCTASSCRKPSDLATEEVGKRSATIRWTENGEATAWQVEVTDLDGGQVTTWNANATTFEIVGLTPDTRYSVRVKPDCEEEKWSDAITFTTEVACPAPTALEVVPTPISATVTWTGDASNYTLRYGTCAEPDPTQPATIIFHADDVWQDGSGYQMLLDADATAYGTTIPETGALSTNCSGNEDIYAEFEYKIPANADGECTTSNIVLDNTITLQIPAGTYDWCITNPTPGDRIWIASTQGNVGGRADDYVFEGGMTYEFHMYLLGSNDATDVTIMCSNVDWTYVDNATSPYTINGLDPETEYFVGVQAVCGGEDGESAWTNTTFTTPSNCDAPTALNVTNLMPTTATLNWTGYQDGYEVWYRPVAQGAELASIDFEDSSMGSWTTIDADGDGYDWVLGSACDGIYLNGGNLAGTGRNDSQDLVVSGSYSNVSGALTPDNYLVSPQVELGGSITFWAAAQDATYSAEVFGVAVSTTSNTDASAFTTIQSFTMTAKGRYINDGSCRTMPIKTRSVLTRSGNRAGGTWYQYTVDLSDYAGQTGYVAIRHYNCTDQFMLDVDDITINGPATEEQEWIMASTDATTLNIEDLLPETTYEWQVRGENRNCSEDGYTEWSEMGNFTTPGLCDPFTSVLIDELTATSITMSWTGYQESYLVKYRTAEDITNITFEDTADEQGDWTVDNLEEGSGWEQLTGYFTFFYTTNPPQTLISPELTGLASNSTLAFDYVAYNAEYPETFKVGFSTTDNSVESFTWGEEVTATDDQYFETYMVDVPAGARYFAIQCTSYDAYALILDNFVIGQYTPAGEWNQIIVDESNVTIDGLTPETLYEVYVQGICGEEEYTSAIGGYFTTPAFSQTIELTAGWNWFSTYVELEDPVELLNRLQEGLGDTGIQIENVIDGVNMNVGDGYWAGDLDGTGLLNEPMYMIEVSEDITVELKGLPTNPENHEITLYPGDFSWIGFPCAEEVDVNVALAGLEPEEGDYIENDVLGVIYYYGEWVGDFDTMIPGRGYMYYSNSTDEKPLIFQTGEAKARHSATVSKLQPAKKQAFVKQNLKIQK